MPSFMAIHKTPPNAITIEQFRGLSQMAQQDKVVKGRRSFGNLTEGNVVCILDAPSEADIARFFEANSVPVESITRIEFEGDGEAVRTV
jgi:hypothetical protein